MSSEDSTRRLTLLASAIAGRSVEVANAEPGSRSWTDRIRIYADNDLEPAARTIAVVVQAALIGADSLSSDVAAALKRPAVAERYLAVEAHRALAAHGAFIPPAARALIDQRQANRSGSPTDSLELALSGAPIALPSALFGAIRPRELKAEDHPEPGTADSSYRPRTDRPRQLSDFEDDDTGETPDAVDVSSPVGGGGAIGQLFRRMLRNQRSGSGGPPGADAPTHRLRSGTGGRGRRVTAVGGRPVVINDGVRVGRPTSFSYPEWDLHRRRYRPDWCTVKEIAPSAAQRAVGRAPNSHALRLPLAKVVLDFDRRRRQLQGDDIDLDACIAAQVEIIGGGIPDESVYIDAVRRRRDLAVLVLLDVSGSAREPGMAGGSVHDSQRSTAAALTFAFNDLGDRTALYGFRSIGRSEVQLIPLKRFEERLGATVLGRLEEVEPGAYTRLGAAIRHGARELEDHGGTRRRLLVVLSDGFAYDHGYEGEYGEADARRALFEARRRGIGCLCLSVGARTDAIALSRVFGTAAHAVVPRPEELAPIARRLFHTALKSAEEQRRSA